MKLYPVTMDTGGIFRCEVSNEFPDFDTVTTAEILNVVGRRKNRSELLCKVSPALLVNLANKEQFSVPSILDRPLI